MKQLFIKLNWIISTQFGLNVRRLFLSLRGLPRFVLDLVKFRKNYQGLLKIKPCLHDRYEEGGTTKSEYFWQDLLVARWICKANPKKHVDIGSRVDGFVAHVASFREIEIFDIRPITTDIPGIVFRKLDLMDCDSVSSQAGYCDSLSCLHALEHFGLGRYGDPIDPLGYKEGLANMAQFLKAGGVFYLSTPIGKERVEFNANWVFDPNNIVAQAKKHGLVLQSLTVITSSGAREVQLDLGAIESFSSQSYNLGLFVFKKLN